MGYCMGGPFTMRTAAALPDRIGAAASFHGGGLVTDAPDSPHLLTPKMTAHFLFAVAENDDMNDPEAIPEPDQIRAFLINPDKGFAFHRGTWHSLNRFLLAPPGGTFLILNTDPNPTQIVDYQQNTSVTYPDLATEANPTSTELKKTYGITFELTL